MLRVVPIEYYFGNRQPQQSQSVPSTQKQQWRMYDTHNQQLVGLSGISSDRKATKEQWGSGQIGREEIGKPGNSLESQIGEMKKTDTQLRPQFLIPSGHYSPISQTDWTLQRFTPHNVHSSFYSSYEHCVPWCRAHCATKRTPDFCFLQGPCIRNCYRIVGNFLRSQKM